MRQVPAMTQRFQKEVPVTDHDARRNARAADRARDHEAACQDLARSAPQGSSVFDSLTIARQLTEAGGSTASTRTPARPASARLPSTATGSLSAEGRSPGAAGAGLFDL